MVGMDNATSRLNASLFKLSLSMERASQVWVASIIPLLSRHSSEGWVFNGGTGHPVLAFDFLEQSFRSQASDSLFFEPRRFQPVDATPHGGIDQGKSNEKTSA
jgi:hypothetical protein